MLKISIIVPSYNQGKFLEETLHSIIEQQYPNLELFVIDGGSTDNSIDIIKKYEHFLTSWISEKDSGQSDALKKGYKLCTGDIISWLCSDDLYVPGALHKVNEVFSSSPSSVGVIHGDSLLFRGDKIVRQDKGYANINLERLLAGMAFPQPSSFLRKSVLDQSGFVKDNYHFGMDYELFSRMVMVCDFVYVDFLFSKYRLHDESKTTTSVAKFINEWSIVFYSITIGMQLSKSRKTLEMLGLDKSVDNSIVAYFDKYKNNRKPDEERLIFYFLSNVIVYDYVSNNFPRVRQVGKHLRENHKELLSHEPTTTKMINRAFRMPSFLLKAAKQIKNYLKQA